MIREVEKLRVNYIRGLSLSLRAYEKLTQIDPAFKDLEHVPDIRALDEMNKLSNDVITALAKAQNEMSKPGAVVNVGGDMIQVGDITDSQDIKIGKDITEQTATGSEINQRVKRDPRFRPPGQ